MRLEKPARCRSCGATIIFLETPSGRVTPFDTYLRAGVVSVVTDDAKRPRSHFATCPEAESWRRARAVAR